MTLIWIDFFLPAFFSFVAIFYSVLITFKSKKNKNIKCVHLGARYSIHWINHVTFRVFRIAIWAYSTIRILFPQIDNVVTLYPSLNSLPFRTLGVAMMMTGFLLALVSNLCMRQTWRSGIDNRSSELLVTNGLYSISRNPAYIGVGLAQLGFFMALPTIFSFVCLIVGLSALCIQIHLEEAHLKSIFGDQYLQYQQQVPRIF